MPHSSLSHLTRNARRHGRMEVIGVLPDVGRNRLGDEPPTAVPIALAKVCAFGCGLHGVCDQVSGHCLCQLGWTGSSCERELYPACRLSLAPQPEPALHHTCASMRTLSPVACECLAQCLDAGMEPCAPSSFGCQTPWRQHARRVRGGGPDMGTRDGFFSALQCYAHPPNLPSSGSLHSGLPAHPAARLTTFAAFLATGYSGADSTPLPALLPVWGAGEGQRGGYAAGAAFVDTSECPRGCSGRGRCLALPTGTEGGGRRRGGRARGGGGISGEVLADLGGGPRQCICVDGAHGVACEVVCSNDCFNHCSGHGECVHGWCRCDPGWFGADCSSTLGLSYRRSALPTDRSQFGHGSPMAQVDQLPPEVRKYAEVLRGRVFMYELPSNLVRDNERWMWRQWGKWGGRGCDPVYNRRIYSAQTHFDAHLMHDDFARTLDPARARLFYVPLFLNQRVTWGADLTAPMRKAVDYVRGVFPHWNASGGKDHVFFIFGERQTCLVPIEIRETAIIVGHWGDADCMSATKDVVVPTITPIQHDLPRYQERLQPAMRKATAGNFERSGPLLLFAGGITSFSASQDNLRKDGVDSQTKQQKWLTRVLKDPCSRPEVSCRNIYSMGVRQAVWRQRLWAEPDMRIVSAGIPDYDTAVPQAHFCLHTEGNGWGARVVDYMAMECLPLMVNDGMLFPYANIINWDTFSIHLRKRQVPQIPDILRNVSASAQLAMHAVQRRYKRAFVWWRPEGLAYEYTLAALGQRAVARGLVRD